MTDFQIRDLRKKYRNDNNLDRPPAILSAVNGSIYDTNDPLSGKVWVRFKQGGGWGPPTLVRGPVGTNIKLSPGMGVFLEKDEEDQLYVAGIRFSSLLSEGVNPLAGNVNDPQTSKMISQDNLVTLLSYSRGGTQFGIKGWMPIVNGVQYVYLGEQGDFTDYPTGSTTDLMPGTGQQCIACMAIKNDYTTSEIALSTAVPTGATITTIDLQEALDGLTAGSTAIAYWLLEGTDKATIYLDVRQVVNTEVASATAPSDAIIKAPDSATRNTITPTATTYPNLILKLMAAQTADFLQFLSSAGATLANVTAAGVATFAGLKIKIGGFVATITHSYTADHTVTLPDEAGTVQLKKLTTKGDLLTYGTTDTRLPVGTNGYVLTADSAQAEGIKWAAASGSGEDAMLLDWMMN